MSQADDALTTKAPTNCTVCAAAMPDDGSRCVQCGATHGEQHRCPFCRVVAEPEPHARLRFACPACGSARVPVQDTAFRPSKAMIEHLRKARSAEASRATWTVGGLVSAGFGVLASALLAGIASIASPPAFAVLMAALVTSMPFVFAVLGWRNAGLRETEAETELDIAWLEAAKALAAIRGTVTAGELRNAFGLGDEPAHLLAARLAASNEITSEITDAGQLALSMRTPELLRVATTDTGETSAAASETSEEKRGKADP